ncbi:MAG TPA: Bax inhibitor-1/YccA family protein [Thermoanaerobaculia bacterium]|nr:Bax inhibitor-1/YccA family protein [Thermoanaerobaculia bacterium]
MDQYRSDAWITAATSESQERERAFIRSVYGWMFGGLALTSVAAYWVASSQAMQALIFGTPGVSIGLMLATLGLVFFLSFRIQKMTPATAAGSFFVFSVLMGLSLSSILFVYTAASIVQAFVVAAGMFAAMSVYGLVTKRDLTSWGSFFFMGLIGILLIGIVNIFVRSSALSFVFSVVGVFVFVGLTAYDTQKLKRYAAIAGPQTTNYAVIGALALYLDLINLFLMLLRLFGSRR